MTRPSTWLVVVVSLGVWGCGGGGPSSGAGWTKVYQPTSLVVGGALVVDGSRVIVGIEKEVAVSDDDGATWAVKSAGLPMDLPFQTMVVSQGKVFAGLTEGVYASADHGETWTKSDPGLPTSVSPYALFDTGSALLLGMNAGASEPGMMGGVFRSTNGGVTWQPSSTGLSASAGASSFARLGTTVFGCSTGVARSTDDGQTWQPSPLPLGNALSAVTLGGAVFVSSSANVVYQGSDGSTWTATGSGLPADPADVLFTDGAVLYATAFASGRDGVWLSKDQGATWQAFNEGLALNDRILGLAVHGDFVFGVDSTANVWRRARPK
ncbi:MAG: hypothetical protein IT380_06835 [Myxococcales bacterium]|nr:hypothetical protein [Myxococcales bacterium]